MTDHLNESAQAGTDKGVDQKSVEQFSAPAQSEADRNFFSERNASSATQSEQLVASGTLPQMAFSDSSTSYAPIDGSPPLRPNPRDQHPTRDSRIRDGSEGHEMPVPRPPGRPVGPMLAMEPLTGSPPLRGNPRDQHPTRDSRIS